MSEYSDLAQKVLDVIEKNPESHDQLEWGVKTPCGTTACVAGHIAIINGDAHYSEPWFNSANQMTRPGNLVLDVEWTNGIGLEDEWINYGQEQLGLDDRDAWKLFMATNNEEAVAALKYLARGQKINWDAIAEETK